MQNLIDINSSNPLVNTEYDLVFYFCKPRASSWLKIRNLLKQAVAFIENTETKEYYGCFKLDKKSVPFIKQIFYTTFDWKCATILLRDCPSINMKEYRYWFTCYMDFFLTENKGFCCGYMHDPKFVNAGMTIQTDESLRLPCKLMKYFPWGSYMDETPYKEQLENNSISSIRCKSGLCPRFNIENFKELLPRDKAVAAFDASKKEEWEMHHSFSGLLKMFLESKLKYMVQDEMMAETIVQKITENRTKH